MNIKHILKASCPVFLASLYGCKSGIEAKINKPQQKMHAEQRAVSNGSNKIENKTPSISPTQDKPEKPAVVKTPDEQIVESVVSIAQGPDLETETLYLNNFTLPVSVKEPGYQYAMADTLDDCKNSESWSDTSAEIVVTSFLDKSYEFYLKVKDENLNETSCVKQTVLVDVTPPIMPDINPIVFTNTAPTSSGDVPVFTFGEAADSHSGLSHYEIKIMEDSPSTEVLGWTEYSSGQKLAEITGLTDDKIYYAQIRAVDKAGNPSSPKNTISWSKNRIDHMISGESQYAFSLHSTLHHDFNGDGKTDYVIDGNNEDKHVHLNNGNGSFASAIRVGNSRNNIIDEMKDFDGDGLMDYLTPEYLVFGDASNELSSIMHNLPLVISKYPQIVDYDYDGDLDVLFIDDNEFFVGINDSLVFTQTSLGVPPFVVDNWNYGDFNGDGKIDLVVGSNAEDKIGWINIDSNFTYSDIITSFANPQKIIVADFDGSNGDDLAVYSNSDNIFKILKNNGGGVFTPSDLISNISMYAGLVDLDGSNGPDLLLSLAGIGMRAYQNDGAGNFSVHFTQSGLNASKFIYEDFDFDGFKDIWTNTMIHINNGSNSFNQSFNVGTLYGDSLSTNGVYDGTTGDINGDGATDFIFSTDGGTFYQLGIGNGNFHPPVELSNDYSTNIQLIDFNNDALIDIVAGGLDVILYANNGSGGYDSYVLAVGHNGTPRDAYAIGDIDGDGFTDLVRGDGDYWSSDVDVFINVGTALPTSFTKTSLIANVKSLTGVNLIDADGVNGLDIQISNNDGVTGYVRLYTNNGSEVFTPTDLVTGGSTGMMTSQVIDVDLDGDQDIVYIQEFGYVYWLEQTSPGSFLNHGYGSQFTYVSWSELIDFKDIDSDGDLDFVTYDQEGSSGNVELYINDGSLVFTEIILNKGMNNQPTVVEFADVNKDGKYDVLMGSYSSGSTYHSAKLFWSEIYLP